MIRTFIVELSICVQQKIQGNSLSPFGPGQRSPSLPVLVVTNHVYRVYAKALRWKTDWSFPSHRFFFSTYCQPRELHILQGTIHLQKHAFLTGIAIPNDVSMELEFKKKTDFVFHARKKEAF